MPNDRFKKGEFVWCSTCDKHHVVKTDGKNPCPKVHTMPSGLPKGIEAAIISDYQKRGFDYNESDKKFYKKKGSKKVD